MKENNLEYCRYILDQIEVTNHLETHAQRGKEKYKREKFLKKLNGIRKELDAFFPDGVDYNKIILEKTDEFSKRRNIFENKKADERMDKLYSRMRHRLEEEREKHNSNQVVSLDMLFEIVNDLCLISSNVSACKSDEAIIGFSTYDTDTKLLNSKILTEKNKLLNKIKKSEILESLDEKENLWLDKWGLNSALGAVLNKELLILRKRGITYYGGIIVVILLFKCIKDVGIKCELENLTKEMLQYQYFECVLEITKIRNDALKEEFCYVW